MSLLNFTRQKQLRKKSWKFESRQTLALVMNCPIAQVAPINKILLFPIVFFLFDGKIKAKNLLWFMK
jgi:hypothetical protein